jgi:hypothetical protein
MLWPVVCTPTVNDDGISPVSCPILTHGGVDEVYCGVAATIRAFFDLAGV